MLPQVREAVGPDVTVLLDSGIRHGADVIAARALGADAVMIGRAYLYGLMAGGERGVARAIDILRQVRAQPAAAGTQFLRRNHPRDFRIP